MQSFYKMFGYPTGVGCLLARKAALAKLRRPWFAGGTITVASVQGDKHYLAEGESAFEDGTLDYLALPAVEIGLRAHRLDRHRHDPRARAVPDRLAARRAAGAAADQRRAARPPLRAADDRPPRRHRHVQFLRRATAAPSITASSKQHANAANISLRTGCFCNPGGGEIALGLTGTELSSCFRQPEHETHLTVDDFRLCIDGKSTGAVRVSLGLVSNVADVDRFIAFAKEFIGQ